MSEDIQMAAQRLLRQHRKNALDAVMRAKLSDPNLAADIRAHTVAVVHAQWMLPAAERAALRALFSGKGADGKSKTIKENC